MWAAVATSCLFVIFRLVVRVRSFKKLQVDDYLVVAAWCMFLASSIVWQIKAYILYWLYDVVHGRLQHLTGFLREYPTFMPHIVTWNVLFYSCLWTIKFSFLVFFRRLQSRVERKQRIWWWVVFTITVITWVACIADIDYNCSLRSATYILSECPVADAHLLKLFISIFGPAAAVGHFEVSILTKNICNPQPNVPPPGLSSSKTEPSTPIWPLMS